MITRRLNITSSGQEIPENTGKAFPLTIHYDDLQNWMEPGVDWHWHAELEFSVILRGEIAISTNRCSYTLSEGDGYFVNRDILHRMYAAPGSKPILLTHLLDASLLSGAPMSIFESKYVAPLVECRELEMLPLYRANTNQRTILEHLQRSYEAADLEEAGYEMIVRNELSGAWLRLMKEAQPYLQSQQQTERPADRRVKQMMLFIQENYAEKLTLEQIAAAANVSTRECLRSFRQVLHTTPFSYLTEQRLLSAANDLLQTGRSVTEIAVDNGFVSSSYFTKRFHERFDMTPGDYRRVHND